MKTIALFLTLLLLPMDSNAQGIQDPSWQRISQVPHARGIIIAKSAVIAYTYDSIYRSIDNGSSWQLVFSDTVGTFEILRSSFPYSIDSSGSIFIIREYNNGSGACEIVYSNDNGLTWQVHSDFNGIYSICTAHDKTYAFAVRHIGAIAGYLTATTDHGETWDIVWDGEKSQSASDFIAMTASPTTGRLVVLSIRVGSSIYLTTTDDGKRWSGLSDTISALSRPPLLQYDVQGNLWGQFNWGLFVSNADGATNSWRRVAPILKNQGFWTRYRLDNHDILWHLEVEDQPTTLYFSRNYGITWDSILAPLPIDVEDYILISERGTLFYEDGDGETLYRSQQPLSGVEAQGEATEGTKVHPNPALNRVTIEYELDVSSKIKIFDLLGRSILEEVVSSKQHSFDISSLPAGTYALQVEHKKPILLVKE